MTQVLNVSIDLSGLTQLGTLVREQVFSRLNTAVEEVAQAGVERWQRAVLAAPLWSTEAHAYAATSRYEMKGPYAAEIISDYKYVEDIETGRPAYDQKIWLQTSAKVRISKTGHRYLIIPFRHNTPGNAALAPAMPPAVYSAAKELKASQITAHGTRPTQNPAIAYQAPGTTVRTRKYLWGGRLEAGLAPKLQTRHKTDPFAGMVRFKEATGGSTYLTFRTMSDKSNGWIIPAKPGMYIAQKVADSLQRTAQDAFGSAVQEDIGSAA